MGEIVEDLLLELKDKKQSHKNDPFLCFCTWDYCYFLENYQSFQSACHEDTKESSYNNL